MTSLLHCSQTLLGNSKLPVDEDKLTERQAISINCSLLLGALSPITTFIQLMSKRAKWCQWKRVETPEKERKKPDRQRDRETERERGKKTRIRGEWRRMNNCLTVAIIDRWTSPNSLTLSFCCFFFFLIFNNQFSVMLICELLAIADDINYSWMIFISIVLCYTVDVLLFDEFGSMKNP